MQTSTADLLSEQSPRVCKRVDAFRIAVVEHECMSREQCVCVFYGRERQVHPDLRLAQLAQRRHVPPDVVKVVDGARQALRQVADERRERVHLAGAGGVESAAVGERPGARLARQRRLDAARAQVQRPHLLASGELADLILQTLRQTTTTAAAAATTTTTTTTTIHPFNSLFSVMTWVS